MEIVDSGRFFQEKILSNHVVTDQLFRYLSKSELLECSLISKKWISPCRQFLHRHHECLLLLDARELEHAPAALLKFVLVTSKLLDDCDEIFYNGVFWNISIKYKRSRLTPNSKRNLKRTFAVICSILKKLPKIKYLTLDPGDWMDIGYLSLVRRYPIDLTEIEKLKIHPWFPFRHYNAFFGKKVFSSLKTAYIPGWYRDDGFDDIIQRVLSSSPALQEWSSEINESHIKYFAKANKLAVIKSFLIPNRTPTWLVDAIDSAKVTFRRLDCSFLNPTAENVETFRRFTCSSTASLQKLELDYEFCKLLVTTPGIRPFIIVREVALTFNSLEWKAEMEADSSFQRIFPNTNVVDDFPED